MWLVKFVPTTLFDAFNKRPFQEKQQKYFHQCSHCPICTRYLEMHFRVHVKGCSFAEPTYFGIGYFFQELNDFIMQGFFSHWSEEEQVSASANTRGECCSQHFQPFETHCWPFYMLDFKSNDQMMNI